MSVRDTCTLTLQRRTAQRTLSNHNSHGMSRVPRQRSPAHKGLSRYVTATNSRRVRQEAPPLLLDRCPRLRQQPFDGVLETNEHLRLSTSARSQVRQPATLQSFMSLTRTSGDRICSNLTTPPRADDNLTSAKISRTS